MAYQLSINTYLRMEAVALTVVYYTQLDLASWTASAKLLEVKLNKVTIPVTLTLTASMAKGFITKAILSTEGKLLLAKLISNAHCDSPELKVGKVIPLILSPSSARPSSSVALASGFINRVTLASRSVLLIDRLSAQAYCDSPQLNAIAPISLSFSLNPALARGFVKPKKLGVVVVEVETLSIDPLISEAYCDSPQLKVIAPTGLSFSLNPALARGFIRPITITNNTLMAMVIEPMWARAYCQAPWVSTYRLPSVLLPSALTQRKKTRHIGVTRLLF
ncbi:MAG: hypothetical protein D4R63_11335 [Methylococcaceae bacterium]|nr:MAG: hypothetical protein D4R63_11335 [Methylococcaceae bacterium]